MPSSPRWVLLALGLVFVMLIAWGVWFHTTQEHALWHETEETLQAIASLQVDQIVRWRSSLLDEAAELTERPFLTDGIERWMTTPTTRLNDLIQGLLQNLQKHDHYYDVKLVDATGQVRLSVLSNPTELEAETQELLKRALIEGKPLLTDLHLRADGLQPHISAIAPLYRDDAGTHKPIGAVILITDAEEFLYPLLESWPIKSHSAESYLVRRDGDSVVYMNDLRHKTNTALKLRIPLDQTQVTAVQAIQSSPGVVRGIDYRGVSVVSAIKPVPGTSWCLLAEMDTEEALAAWRSESFLILGMLLGLLLAMAALTGAFFLHYRKTHYKDLFTAERKARENEARYRTLFNGATEGIALADAETGELLDFNQAFLDLTGYSRDELLGKPQRILHPAKALPSGLTQSFASRLHENTDLVVREEVVTKNGAIRQMDVKANSLEVNGRLLIQGFFRDVTAVVRYEHERETTLNLLRLLNDSNNTHELIRSLTGFLKEWTGCDAVGVRLREGDDFPYYETRGFTPEFVEAENHLCAYDEHGQVICDSDGNPVLDCMCGNILCGHFNPSLPYFTQKGSFWTNCTTELLATTSEADRQTRTRNRCNGDGYESVALFPLRFEQETLGLLQVNHRAKGFFTPELLTFLENASGQIAIALSQRRTREALHKSEEKFRTIADWTYDWELWSDPDGKLLYVSPSAERITGHRADEFYSNPGLLDQIIHPDDKNIWVEHMRNRLHGSNEVRELEFRIINREGEIRWIQHLCRPVFDPQGKSLGWRVSNRDITDHLNLQREKESLQSQLLQSQKLEAVGRLAGGVAHDFNNMLQSILGYSALALREVQPGDFLHECLNEIQKAGQRSADLTRQLLAFARKQTVSPKVLDLNDTITGMLRMLQRLIGEDINLAWIPGHNLWQIFMDPSQIDQILANLAVNARDAIGGVGHVCIETSNTLIDHTYLVDHIDSYTGEFVVLSVSDDGCGMDRETISHIFEPFFTTKPLGMGTGLGLATIYGIIRQNNGFVNVYSEPGKGTTFRIYLPRYRDEAASREEQLEPGAPQGGTETILIVEDEETVLALGKRILEGLGYTVLTASTVSKAIQIVGEYQGDIHLLITDVVMPDMNGKELSTRLLSLKPGMKVLYMSGYTSNVIAHRGILDEDVLFVQKPFTMEGVARKVREALD